MKTIKKRINTTIIGKDSYDLTFEMIDKVIIKHGNLEVKGKDGLLIQDSAIFLATLLLIEEVNKMYSICEDKEDKAVIEKAIIKLYDRVKGGRNNGRKRSKGRNSKKYPKNR